MRLRYFIVKSVQKLKMSGSRTLAYEALDKKGNSIAGVKILEELSNRYNLNIF